MSDEPRQDTGVTYIREIELRYRGARRKASAAITDPHAAVRFARATLHDDAREHFLAIYLDARQRPLAYQIVSIGTVNQSLVHPREVFRPGLLAGASGIVLLHSHPSGDPTPSLEDREVTERLAKAGRILGIHILDHVVFTTEGRFHSFAHSHPELLR